MLGNFFKKTTNLSLLTTLVFFVVYFLLAIVCFDNQGLTVGFMIEKVGLVFVFFLILFLVYFINNKNNLTQSKGYTFLLIVLLISIFTKTMINKPIIFSNLFLLLGFRRVYSLRTNKQIKEKIFDASFWICIATLCYNWSIVYIILLLAAIIFFNKGTLKNLLIPIVGVVVPLFLFFTYHFYNDNLEFFFELTSFKFSMYFQSYNVLELFIPLTIVFSVIIWALIFNNITIKGVSKEFKKSHNLILIHLVLSLILVIFSFKKDGSEMLFLAFPFGIVVTNYLEKIKDNWFVELIIGLFLTLPLVSFVLTFLAKS